MQLSPTVLGRYTASLLSTPPQHNLSEEALPKLLPIFVQSGAAGLLWSRLKETPLAEAFAPLQDLYRQEALAAALHEREISRCAALFAAAGVRVLFGKGWSVARCYGGWGLRSCGDIDLYIDASQKEAAQRIIHQNEPWEIDLDLHTSCQEFSDDPLDALWERAEQITVRGVEVRLLPLEEHLRLLCLHPLRHGAARPVWFCDIERWLQRYQERLDWAHFWSVSGPKASWLSAAFWLAQQTLGVTLPGAVLAHLRPLPAWALESVYRAWGEPYYARVPVFSLWKTPLQMLQEVPKHWPNPIEAVVGLGLSFVPGPTLFWQASEFLRRSVKALQRVGKKVGG